MDWGLVRDCETMARRSAALWISLALMMAGIYFCGQQSGDEHGPD